MAMTLIYRILLSLLYAGVKNFERSDSPVFINPFVHNTTDRDCGNLTQGSHIPAMLGRQLAYYATVDTLRIFCQISNKTIFHE